MSDVILRWRIVFLRVASASEANEPLFCASKLMLEPMGLMRSVDLLPCKYGSDETVKSIDCFTSIALSYKLIKFECQQTNH